MPFAPCLSDDDVAFFKTNLVARDIMLMAYKRFLEFMGITISDGVYCAESSEIWSTPNHNHLRITRVLSCMISCGFEDEAERLFSFLTRMCETYPILKSSWIYWAEKVGA